MILNKPKESPILDITAMLSTDIGKRIKELWLKVVIRERVIFLACHLQILSWNIQEYDRAYTAIEVITERLWKDSQVYRPVR